MVESELESAALANVQLHDLMAAYRSSAMTVADVRPIGGERSNVDSDARSSDRTTVH